MTGPSGDFDGDVRRVRQGVEHGGALLGLGHQRLDVLPRRVRVDVEGHLDVISLIPLSPSSPIFSMEMLDNTPTGTS